MATIVFSYGGHSYSYNQAADLLEVEKINEPGIFEPLLDPDQKKKVLKYYFRDLMVEEEPE